MPDVGKNSSTDQQIAEQQVTEPLTSNNNYRVRLYNALEKRVRAVAWPLQHKKKSAKAQSRHSFRRNFGKRRILVLHHRVGSYTLHAGKKALDE